MDLVDIVIVISYLVITLAIGMYTGRGVKSLKEYSISNQEFSTPVLIATIAATLIGGGSSMGLASKIFVYGIPFFFIFMGRPLTNLFWAYFVAPRMGAFNGRLSVADVMGQMYGKWVQVVVAISGVLLSLGQMATQVTATGFIFEYFLGVDFVIGAVVGSLIIVIYTSYGGIRSVTFTDVFQFCILVVIVPIIANLGILDMGGYSGLFAKTRETHFIFPVEKAAITYLVSMAILEYIPIIHPPTVQRFLMSPSVAHMRQSLMVTAWLQVPFYALVAAIGLAAYALKPDLDPNLAMPYVISTLMPAGVKGLAAAGMMAIIMSTADSHLNTASILFTNDFLKPLFNNKLSEKILLLNAKIVSALIGFIAIFVAISFRDVLDIFLYFANFWAPIVVFPFYARIFGMRASQKSFLWAALGGMSAFLYWDLYAVTLYPILPSFFAGFIGNTLTFLTLYYFMDRKAPPPEPDAVFF